MANEKVAQAGQYLTFNLNSQEYGVPIGVVREINRVTEITSVPQTPLFLSGVINLRGKVIPVVDLRLKFGLPMAERTKQTCIIVIEGEIGQIGMIVDSVKGVMVLTQSQIEPPPTMGNEGRMAYVLGVGKLENSVLILIDIIKALGRDELTKLIESTSSFPTAA